MEGEPLDSEPRKVIQQNDSLYVNVTKYAERNLDISVGDEVDVHTYEACIVVVPGEVSDRGERE
jgi:hypothetical protein